jgi:hypothetical protein
VQKKKKKKDETGKRKANETQKSERKKMIKIRVK